MFEWKKKNSTTLMHEDDKAVAGEQIQPYCNKKICNEFT